VFLDGEQVATLNVEDDVLDPMPRSALSFAFFASSSEVLHRYQHSTTCT